MWDPTAIILLSASTGDKPWYKDHTGMSWIFGFHGLFWLLMFVVMAVVLILSYRLATRDRRPTDQTIESWKQQSSGKTLDSRNKTK